MLMDICYLFMVILSTMYLLFKFSNCRLLLRTLLILLELTKLDIRLTTFGKQRWWLADPIDLHIHSSDS